MSQHIYVLEINKQCRLARNAALQLNRTLQILQKGPDEPSDQNASPHDEAFRAIHSFLTHASNISRILWPALPSKGKSETEEGYEQRTSTREPVRRSRVLRAELGLPDEHILKDRKLRDHLEPFDERLDDWRATSPQRIIVNDIIGAANSVSGVAATDMMRCYDPSTKRFLLRGEIFNIQDIATAVVELLPRTSVLARQLWERLVNESSSAGDADQGCHKQGEPMATQGGSVS